MPNIANFTFLGANTNYCILVNILDLCFGVHLNVLIILMLDLKLY